jgi:hypothetical protein
MRGATRSAQAPDPHVAGASPEAATTTTQGLSVPLAGDQPSVIDSCTHERVEVVSSGPISEHEAAGAHARLTQRALCSLCKRQVERHESGGVWTAWETVHAVDESG